MAKNRSHSSRRGTETSRANVVKKYLSDASAGARLRLRSIVKAGKQPTTPSKQAAPERDGGSGSYPAPRPSQGRGAPNEFIPRRGEAKERVYFRSDRLFAEGHRWYFATREGATMGPYRDRTEAKLALATFIARCMADTGTEQPDQTDYGCDDDTVEAMVGELVRFLQILLERGDTSATAWANQRIQLLREPACSEEHRDWRASALEYLMEESG